MCMRFKSVATYSSVMQLKLYYSVYIKPETLRRTGSETPDCRETPNMLNALATN